MKYDRRDDLAFIRWAKQIKVRDHFTCQICDRRGVELHAHHLNAYNWCIEERYDLDNGITLCRQHHEDFHSKYEKGNNTREQFEEYKLFCEALMKLVQNNNTTKNIVRNIIEICRDDGYAPDGYTA